MVLPNVSQNAAMKGEDQIRRITNYRQPAWDFKKNQKWAQPLHNKGERRMRLWISRVHFLTLSGVMWALDGRAGVGRAPAEQELLALPAPDTQGQVPLETALQERRSVRTFRDQPLTLRAVSQLLWAAQGRTDPRGFRTAPSAGALYPLAVYVVAGTVAGLAPGVYRYTPDRHRLERRRAGDVRAALAEAALGQPWVAAAPASLVFTAEIRRTAAKYGNRAARYVFMEAGHAAQNACLEAVALNLGSVPVGAFREAAVDALLELDADAGEVSIYILSVGHVQNTQRSGAAEAPSRPDAAADQTETDR